jgi:hypothetical protein
VRNLDSTVQRQSGNGGFRPIKEDHSEFTRTYSSAIALWSLLEARHSPAVYNKIGNKYDENIRIGINWLLRTYKEKQGWVQNPNRIGQTTHFDGLTAQTLHILRRAEQIEAFAYISNEPVYRLAKSEFTRNRQFAGWSPEKDNSSSPDGDARFPGTDFLAEGSTFLWFPWTLAELATLSNDPHLSETDRAAAARLRADILSANFEKFENYVEIGDFTYILAENLYCVSSYLNTLNKQD